MKDHIMNPAHWRLSILLKLGHENVHELARKAVGTLTSYKLIVGRCLLAMHESKGYKKHGCSSAIHYACSRLGLNSPVARECRRVVQRLQGLPELTLAAELGTVEWGKLREIVRRAVPTTERYWIALAKKHSYKEIEQLVSRTPDGSVPGEVDAADTSYRSELRCAASPGLFAMLEQVRRVLSVEKEEAVTTAEVLEMALASMITSRPFDPEALENARAAADKDLLAEEARRLPIVEEARELAMEMGLLTESEFDAEDRCCDPEDDFNISECPARVIFDMMATADTDLEADSDPSKCPARVIPGTVETIDTNLEAHSDPSKCSARVIFGSAMTNKTSFEGIAPETPSAENSSSRSWQNSRLRFNPKSRSATKTQRAELLRRDGWCCRTPGCPNKVWLHLHHVHEYSQGGETTPGNLICLCSGCHRNIHQGILKITESLDGELIYTNSEGQRLDRQVDLELADWLDVHFGWSGEELDSHQAKLWQGEWAVFAS